MNETISAALDGPHDRADWFSKEFADANYEMGQAQNFMRILFCLFADDTGLSMPPMATRAEKTTTRCGWRFV